jgi:hypothetical protein
VDLLPFIAVLQDISARSDAFTHVLKMHTKRDDHWRPRLAQPFLTGFKTLMQQFAEDDSKKNVPPENWDWATAACASAGDVYHPSSHANAATVSTAPVGRLYENGYGRMHWIERVCGVTCTRFQKRFVALSPF